MTDRPFEPREEASNIAVVVRVRPRDREEIPSWWACDGERVTQLAGPNGKPIPASSFSFDHVFGERSSTREIYESFARPISMSALAGVNATIFCYGQTATGKTFTMTGCDREPGVIPLVINDLFSRIQGTVRPESFFPSLSGSSSASSIEFCIRISYVEIYNETINDLLNPGATNLRILESDRGVFLDCREEVVTRPAEVLDFMRRGDEKRHTGATNMNERSSRSHTIFRMTIESTLSEESEQDEFSSGGGGGKIAHVSMLTLVDLAGSERIAHTGAEGVRKVEAGQINKSLLTLGTVIFKLSEENSAHIPYRDSKLTRLLQPSLGGNARTGIICTISLLQAHVEETLSTLKFASRAKKIENAPIVNEVLDTTTVIGNLKREIRLLKLKLSERDVKDREASVTQLATLSRSIIATPARKKKEFGTSTSDGAPAPPATTSTIVARTPGKPSPDTEEKRLRELLEEAEARTAQQEEAMKQMRATMEEMVRDATSRAAAQDAEIRGLRDHVEEAARQATEHGAKEAEMRERIVELDLRAKKAAWDKETAEKEYLKSREEIADLKREAEKLKSVEAAPQATTLEARRAADVSSDLEVSPPPTPVRTGTCAVEEIVSLRAELARTRERLLLAEVLGHVPQGDVAAQVSSLGAALLKATDERGAAKEKLAQAQEELKDAAQTKKDLKRAEEDREVLRKQAAEARQKAQSEMKEEMAKVRREAKDQQQKTKEGEQLAAKLSETKEKLRAALEEKTKLQGEKNALEKEAKMLAKQRDSLEKEAEKMKGSGQAAALQKQVEKLEVQLRAAKESAAEMQTATQRIAALERDNEALRQAVSQATEKLAARERRVAEAEQKMSQQLTELSFALEEQTARARELEKSREAGDTERHRATAKEWEAHAKALASQLAASEERAIVAERETAGKCEQIASMQIEVDAMREAIQADAEAKNARIAELEQSVQTIQSAYELKVKHLAEEEAAKEAQRGTDADFLERIKDLEIQRDELMKENLQVRKRLSQMAALERQLEEQKYEREAEQRRWRAEKAKADGDIKNFRQYIALLEEQNAGRQAEIDSLRTETHFRPTPEDPFSSKENAWKLLQ